MDGGTVKALLYVVELEFDVHEIVVNGAVNNL